MRDRWYERADPKYLTYLSSKEWKARRALVLARCGGTCERCGKFAVSEIHHLTYARIYHERPEDLQGVCEYCHDFMHEKRPDDGTAEHERQERQRSELRSQVEQGRDELRRLDEHPHRYRDYSSTPIPDDRELMQFLRQHPRVIGAFGEKSITQVRLAKRRRGAAVAFRIEWNDEQGKGWMPMPDARAWLRDGVVFETERKVWVDVPNVRWFVRHNEVG